MDEDVRKWQASDIETDEFNAEEGEEVSKTWEIPDQRWEMLRDTNNPTDNLRRFAQECEDNRTTIAYHLLD